MRISDWSSDVCSSDLCHAPGAAARRCAASSTRSHANIRKQFSPESAAEQRRRDAGPDGASTLRSGGFPRHSDRKSVVEGKSRSVRVDLGGRRIIKKQKKTYKNKEEHQQHRAEH